MPRPVVTAQPHAGHVLLRQSSAKTSGCHGTGSRHLILPPPAAYSLASCRALGVSHGAAGTACPHAANRHVKPFWPVVTTKRLRQVFHRRFRPPLIHALPGQCIQRDVEGGMRFHGVFQGLAVPQPFMQGAGVRAKRMDLLVGGCPRCRGKEYTCVVGLKGTAQTSAEDQGKGAR
eukprot:scaffold1374_cov115-Isochrysis_galbana.AAC.10